MLYFSNTSPLLSNYTTTTTFNCNKCSHSSFTCSPLHTCMCLIFFLCMSPPPPQLTQTRLTPGGALYRQASLPFQRHHFPARAPPSGPAPQIEDLHILGYDPTGRHTHTCTQQHFTFLSLNKNKKIKN